MPLCLWLYREFFTPIVNGYLWRFGLMVLLWGTAYLLRHNRRLAEQYGMGLVMLGMLRLEDVASLRSAHRLGLLLYFLSLGAAGWFGYYCYDQSQAKPVVVENPLKDLKSTPTNPLSPSKFGNPLAPGKVRAKGKLPGPGGSPYAPMPPRR